MDWRARAERDLGRRIDDDIWQRLVDKDFVADAEHVAEDGYAALLEEARYLTSLRSGRTPRRSESPAEARALFSLQEQLRAHALYEYFAKAAASLPAVKEIREWILDGRVLSADTATAFVESPAAALFAPDEFLGRGIPMTGHRASIQRAGRERDDGGRLYEYFVVRVDPPGQEFGLRQLATASAARTFLEYPGEGGTVGRVKIAPASVLDAVKMAAQELTQRFPWAEYQAVWFLLTGAEPLWWPIRRSISRLWSDEYDYQAITMVIEPWVTAETVKQAFRAAQRGMFAGRENRPIAPKNLQLFRFCLSRMESIDAPPDWDQLRREWNELYPDAPFSDTRAFRRSFDRVRRQLVHPRYGEPW